MTRVDDLSRSLVALDQNTTLVAVVEMSQSSWLIAGMVPGLERRPLTKLDTSALLQLLWHPRPGATAFGWRAGCAPRGSRPT